MSLRVCTLLLLVAAPAFCQGDSLWLTSGEFRAGTITAMGPFGVRFLVLGGEATLVSWAGVLQLKSPGTHTLVFQNGDRMTGRLEGMAEGRIQLLLGEDGWIRVDPASLAEPVPPPEEKKSDPEVTTPLEPSDWSGKVALLATVRSGNVDSLVAALHAEAERKWEEDRLLAILNATYGETDGSRTSESLGGRIRYEHYWSKKTYCFGQIEALHDAVQGIDLRMIATAGVGHMIWKDDDKHYWSVEGGISAIYEDTGGDEDSSLDPGVRFATEYRDVFFENLEFTQLLEVLFPVTDIGDWIGRSLTVLSVPVSKSISLRASLELNYQADPPGDTENLDILGLVGLEYKF